MKNKSGITLRQFVRNDLYGLLSVIVLNLIILWVIFGNMLLNLNNVSFAKDGDGLKSYYSAIYHIKYDDSYHYTNSMNYPFGEHIFFTDSKPLVANSVKWISNNVIDISHLLPGIFNSLMLLSIVLGVVFIYSIFRKFRVDILVAIIAASSIIWLSPQLGRLGGHFALAYISHIPGIIFFLLLYIEKPNFKRSLFIAVWCFILAMTHFYYYGIVAILLLVFWLWAFLSSNDIKIPNGVKIKHLLIQLIVPLLTIQIYLYLTDIATDRPSTPWGFMYFRAYPESVFLPLHKPYADWITQIFNTNYIDWEGYNYAGASVSLFFLGIVIFAIYRLFKKDLYFIINPFNNSFAATVFWASTIALLYSFAVPFVFNLEWLIKYLGPLKQMRGVARFAWLFFYGMQIIMFVVLISWLKKRQKPISYLLLSVVLALNISEAYYNAKPLKSQIDNQFTLFNDNMIIDEPEKYQAIIPLPYFHVGSENIWWDDVAAIKEATFSLSVNNGIPITGVFLSRTSLNQTLEQIELFLPMNEDPVILDRYNNNNLLLVTSRDHDYQGFNKTLIENAEALFNIGKHEILSLTMNSMRVALKSKQYDMSNHLKAKQFYNQSFSDIRSYNQILVEEIAEDATEVHIIFNVDDINVDLLPRTAIWVGFEGQDRNIVDESWQSIGHYLIGLKDDRTTGVVEIKKDIPEDVCKIIVAATNRDMKKFPLILQNIKLLINYE